MLSREGCWKFSSEIFIGIASICYQMHRILVNPAEDLQKKSAMITSHLFCRTLILNILILVQLIGDYDQATQWATMGQLFEAAINFTV